MSEDHIEVIQDKPGRLKSDDKIYVKGRFTGMKTDIEGYLHLPTGILRIDDNNNPEFWMEMDLSTITEPYIKEKWKPDGDTVKSMINNDTQKK